MTPEEKAQRDIARYLRYGTMRPSLWQYLLRFVCWVLGED